MIFTYEKRTNVKQYTIGDLDIGETFMLTNPDDLSVSVDVFKNCSVYALIAESSTPIAKRAYIDLDDLEAGIRYLNRDVRAYPVICKCSVSLYPDVQ